MSDPPQYVCKHNHVTLVTIDAVGKKMAERRCMHCSQKPIGEIYSINRKISKTKPSLTPGYVYKEELNITPTPTKKGSVGNKILCSACFSQFALLARHRQHVNSALKAIAERASVSTRKSGPRAQWKRPPKCVKALRLGSPSDPPEPGSSTSSGSHSVELEDLPRPEVMSNKHVSFNIKSCS